MLIVGSSNVQNRFFLPNYNGFVNKEDCALLLKHFLYKYHIDILGTQEFVSWYLKRTKDILKNEYQVVGDFRYTKLILKKFNETNSIITKREIKLTKTIHLPTLPAIPPRILTYAIIGTKEFGNIAFLNTHLTLKNKKVQEKQLKEILRQIRRVTTPLILTGDFNMTISNPLLKEFIEGLQLLEIERVPIMEKTYKTHKKEKAIDHIFVSKEFQVAKFKVIKDEELSYFSDHYPIVVWLKKKEGF